MKLHIVSGFLGSGKSTAIAGASRMLSLRGERVAVVTNDQGHQLVDTAYLRGAGIPTEEVVGGCFCCRFDELVTAFSTLRGKVSPTVIFAEAVGSCTDLVATVIRPLNELPGIDVQVSSFSVFVDLLLAGNWLSGLGLPFSDDICYIFEKQLEEAGLIVVNKSDLASAESGLRIAQAMQARFPNAEVLLHSALDPDQSSVWLAHIERQARTSTRDVAVDYERYGSGEARLGWYNSRIHLSRPPDVAPFFRRFLDVLRELLREGSVPVGHLKIAFPRHPQLEKVSMTAHGDWQGFREWSDPLSELELTLNARVEYTASGISQLVESSLEESSAIESSCSWQILEEEHFHPAFPRPTHRLPS